jgi:hypothetical protein
VDSTTSCTGCGHSYRDDDEVVRPGSGIAEGEAWCLWCLHDHAPSRYPQPDIKPQAFYMARGLQAELSADKAAHDAHQRRTSEKGS